MGPGAVGVSVRMRTSRIIRVACEPQRGRAGSPQLLPQGVVHRTTIDWRPWNEALNMVNLVADKDIAEAAHVLDEQIWRLHTKVKRGLTPRRTGSFCVHAWSWHKTASSSPRAADSRPPEAHFSVSPGGPLQMTRSGPHELFQTERSQWQQAERQSGQLKRAVAK